MDIITVDDGPCFEYHYFASDETIRTKLSLAIFLL